MKYSTVNYNLEMYLLKNKVIVIDLNITPDNI